MPSNSIIPTTAGYIAAAARESRILQSRINLMVTARSRGNMSAARLAANRVQDSIQLIDTLLIMAAEIENSE
ncbi:MULTISPECIES: hypothetical protein [unclassified Streptomyces]|uniref:hypothetical protein n=1 Tax=Streptomyces sp. NPDC056835 TaxID=3345956 RepID=UPI0036CBE7DB